MLERNEGLLKRLIGKRLWAANRAGEMATFQIGDRQTVRKFRGDMVEVGEYALHVQCPWRITRGLDIVVGSSDLYYPPSPRAEPSRGAIRLATRRVPS
jgi:hypothetical protein